VRIGGVLTGIARQNTPTSSLNCLTSKLIHIPEISLRASSNCFTVNLNLASGLLRNIVGFTLGDLTDKLVSTSLPVLDVAILNEVQDPEKECPWGCVSPLRSVQHDIERIVNRFNA
jgi:hypothetical protein